MSPDRIPVIIVTGFLGSGKTTFLNRILKDPGLKRTVVIVNEFGEIGLDHLFVGVEDEAILLDNGCICCTVIGDLALTLATLLTRQASGAIPPFERVIVETTGLADPTPIMQAIAGNPSLHAHYRCGAVVALVDCVHANAQLDRQVEAVRQVALADTILLSKGDMSYPQEVALVREKLRTINPAAPVLFNDITDPSGLLSQDTNRIDALRPWIHHSAACAEGTCDDADHAHGHSHADMVANSERGHLAAQGIMTFSMRRANPVAQKSLALWLHNLAAFYGQRILRMKGIVNVEGKPVAVHVVESLVHDPEQLPDWPDDSRETRLVFITRGLTRADLEHLLQSMDYAAPSPTNTIDAAEFERFKKVLRPFHQRA